MSVRIVLALALSGALLACSPGETNVNVTDKPAGDGAAATAKRIPLPDCSETVTQDAGADGWKHPDCRMNLTDNSMLAIEARYTPAEDSSTKVTVQVVQPGDATVQTIEETMGNTTAGPLLQDVDKDGHVDILLPLETGGVNTSWAIWRQGDDQKFFRVGELNGTGIKHSTDNYLALPYGVADNQVDVAFLKLEKSLLTELATATVFGRGEPGSMKIDCTVKDDGGLAQISLTQAAAEAKFCAEPAVTEIFK